MVLIHMNAKVHNERGELLRYILKAGRLRSVRRVELALNGLQGNSFTRLVCGRCIPIQLLDFISRSTLHSTTSGTHSVVSHSADREFIECNGFNRSVVF